jgi:hypothetical protein
LPFYLSLSSQLRNFMAMLTKSSSDMAHPRISVELYTKYWELIFLRSWRGDEDRWLGLPARLVSVYYIFVLLAYVNVTLAIQIGYISQVHIERGGPFGRGPWPWLAPSSPVYNLDYCNK